MNFRKALQHGGIDESRSVDLSHWEEKEEMEQQQQQQRSSSSSSSSGSSNSLQQEKEKRRAQLLKGNERTIPSRVHRQLHSGIQDALCS
ncbi:hypothetical protein X777_08778 [Ooceraea biroi]|uniref:Uncharacterized protein n=1 Tax=Ooceraea biroi TaxID=2015173 RepID=A0A026W8J7_OOCBI|nr:hypothetical protein X777_08778 [Ooceraea biroi]